MSDIDHIPDPMRQLAELFAHIRRKPVRYDIKSAQMDIGYDDTNTIVVWREFFVTFADDTKGHWSGTPDEYAKACEGFEWIEGFRIGKGT